MPIAPLLTASSNRTRRRNEYERIVVMIGLDGIGAPPRGRCVDESRGVGPIMVSWRRGESITCEVMERPASLRYCRYMDAP